MWREGWCGGQGRRREIIKSVNFSMPVFSNAEFLWLRDGFKPSWMAEFG